MPRGGQRQGSGRKAGVKVGPTAKTKAIRRRVQQHVALTADAVVEQMRRGALWDIADLFDAKNNLLPIREMPVGARVAIAGFEVLKRNLTSGDGHTDTVLKVKLVDRSRYVEMAAKHHGLLTEKIELTGQITLGQKIAAARQRLQKAKS